jgi:hypothetical protein
VGAITGSLSQTPALSSPAAYHWKFVYFIGAAMVVALSTHLMVVTVYIAVFGEGLALRGPGVYVYVYVYVYVCVLNPLICYICQYVSMCIKPTPSI